MDVERAIEEGVMIATVAISMSVANRMLVRTVREGRVYDPADAAAITREEMAALSEEQRSTARSLRRTGAKVSRRRRYAAHQHDYVADDREALKSRATIAEAVADRLDAADEETVRVLAEAARERALGQLEQGISARPRWTTDPRQAETDTSREERLRAFVEFDLALLGADG